MTHADLVRHARLTGVMYLVIIVCAMFGEAFVRSGLVVRGDSILTATNIQSSLTLFRLGFMGDLVAFLADVAVAVLLYVLLRPAGRTLALMAAAFRLVGTAIYGANLLNHAVAAHLLSASVMEPAQAQALALMFLDIHKLGYDLGLVFFGVHCVLVGWLVWRSTAFPGVLGWLMAAAGVVYLVGSSVAFLAPQAAGAVAPFYAVPLLGEVAFTAWLLVKGVRRAAN